MNNYYILKHPLISAKMTLLRDKSTKQERFRNLVDELTSLVAFEATKHIKLKEHQVETPLALFDGFLIDEEIVITPILRAGLSMVNSMLKLMPHSKVGHIGIKRDDNKVAHTYSLNLPKNLDNSLTLIVDPMLATGSSLIEAISILKRQGAKRIVYLGILGTKEGIDNVLKAHPDIYIYLAELDPKLNEKGYIVPGLGDAGDRLYGTLDD